MADPVIVLKEWVINYLKHKDIYTKCLKEIKEVKADRITVVYKDKTQSFFILPSIDFSHVIKQLEQGNYVGIVTLNNEQNIKALVKNWNNVSRYPKLSIYFVNPYSIMEKHWAIIPYIHNKVCDHKNLLTGLRSMSELVESITQDEMLSLDPP